MVWARLDLSWSNLMKRSTRKVDIKIEANIAKILLAIAAILAVILR
jgi:hypothetical protein